MARGPLPADAGEAVSWVVELPGQPPSWNASYRIARQRGSRADGANYSFSTMVKTKKLVQWQEEMTMVVRTAKPSRWSPPPKTFIPIAWEVFLTNHIDMDNLQKAINDVVEAATGVNDKWFYPIFRLPVVGVPQRQARVVLTIGD